MANKEITIDALLPTKEVAERIVDLAMGDDSREYDAQTVLTRIIDGILDHEWVDDELKNDFLRIAAKELGAKVINIPDSDDDLFGDDEFEEDDGD
jgi:hypothetical protein